MPFAGIVPINKEALDACLLPGTSPPFVASGIQYRQTVIVGGSSTAICWSDYKGRYRAKPIGNGPNDSVHVRQLAPRHRPVHLPEILAGPSRLHDRRPAQPAVQEARRRRRQDGPRGDERAPPAPMGLLPLAPPEEHGRFHPGCGVRRRWLPEEAVGEVPVRHAAGCGHIGGVAQDDVRGGCGPGVRRDPGALPGIGGRPAVRRRLLRHGHGDGDVLLLAGPRQGTGGDLTHPPARRGACHRLGAEVRIRRRHRGRRDVPGVRDVHREGRRDAVHAGLRRDRRGDLHQ